MDIKEKIKGHLQAAEMRQGTTDYTPYVDALMSDIESEIQSRLSSMVDEEKNKCKECQSWYDDALDWRESEIAKAVIADRIKNMTDKPTIEQYRNGLLR